MSLFPLVLLLSTLAIGAARTGIGDDDPRADELVLKSGRRVVGRVVFETADEVVLRVRSRDTTYARDDIQELTLLRIDLERGLDLIDSLPYGGIGLHVEAARQLEEWGLVREARLLYWTVLSLDATHREAHEALGHKYSGKSWRAYRDGRGSNFDHLIAVSREWSNAWEFDTSHFRLRSNLDLGLCLAVAIDLERIYRVFYELFGEDFRLYQLVTPMDVFVYADRKSYPELSGHLAGYFSPGDNCLYLDASGGLDRALLVHEVAHELLFNSAYRARKKEGSIPGWLDEGLAQYMQAAVDATRPRLEFVPGRENDAWLATHARASKALAIGRILNLRQDDFRGTDAVLMYAQSWSLVQFCMHAQQGRYRPGFLRFVQSCYAGKSSSTHFEQAMGVDKEEIERAWTEYVKSAAAR